MAFVIVAHRANTARGLSLQTATEALAALAELEAAGYTIQHLSGYRRAPLDRRGLERIAGGEATPKGRPVGLF